MFEKFKFLRTCLVSLIFLYVLTKAWISFLYYTKHLKLKRFCQRIIYECYCNISSEGIICLICLQQNEQNYEIRFNKCNFFSQMFWYQFIYFVWNGALWGEKFKYACVWKSVKYLCVGVLLLGILDIRNFLHFFR